MHKNQWVQTDMMVGIQARWQEIVDILALTCHAQSSITTQFTDNGLLVTASSSNENNPYKKGDVIALNDSIFCRKVVERREPLFVSNPDYREIPNTDTNTDTTAISYCGYPVFLPDGTLHGTLCVLEATPLHEHNSIKKLVDKFRRLIEHDLLLAEHLNEMSEAAFTDDLTGILNRRGFLLLAKQQIQMAIRYEKHIGLLFVDINGLKAINDQHGHPVGDRVIQAHAKQIQSCLRESELVARYGGDEFIVFVLVQNEQELTAVNNRFGAAISNCTLDNGITLKASIGQTFAASNSDFDLASLITIADQEMYAIKSQQRNAS